MFGKAPVHCQPPPTQGVPDGLKLALDEMDAEMLSVGETEDEGDADAEMLGEAVIVATPLAVVLTEELAKGEGLDRTLSVGDDEAVALALAVPLKDGVAVPLPLSDGETVALPLSDGDSEALVLPLNVSDDDAVTLALRDGDGEALAVAVGETEPLALTLVEGDAVAETESDGEDDAVGEDEAVTEGVMLGVPMQTHRPFWEEPQLTKQQRFTQGVTLAVSEGDAAELAETLADAVAGGELDGVPVTAGVWLGVAVAEASETLGEGLAVGDPVTQTQVKGNTSVQIQAPMQGDVESEAVSDAEGDKEAPDEAVAEEEPEREAVAVALVDGDIEVVTLIEAAWVDETLALADEEGEGVPLQMQ